VGQKSSACTIDRGHCSRKQAARFGSLTKSIFGHTGKTRGGCEIGFFEHPEIEVAVAATVSERMESVRYSFPTAAESRSNYEPRSRLPRRSRLISCRTSICAASRLSGSQIRSVCAPLSRTCCGSRAMRNSVAYVWKFNATK
jgi:hypothetical protein